MKGMGGCCFNLIFSSNIFKNSKNQSEWLLVDFPRQRAYFWMPFLRNLEVLDISFSFDTYEWWVGPGSQRCHRSRGIILHGVVSLCQVRTTIPFVDRWARAEGFLCFGADSPRGYMPVLMQKTTMAHACSRDKHHLRWEKGSTIPYKSHVLGRKNILHANGILS
jgi:hypothetical protein